MAKYSLATQRIIDNLNLRGIRIPTVGTGKNWNHLLENVVLDSDWESDSDSDVDELE